MPSRPIGLFDDDYPRALRELSSPPDTLWVRGALPSFPGVAVVGTRRPSPQGERYASELAARLVIAGFAVWSGGALGIDRAAHRGALSAGGTTVLVAGGGLDARYPADHDGLYKEVERSGALVSIVGDAAPPQPWVFLARNGVLAALTVATVIVECPLKSGARSTSAVARKLGRPVWIAPQPPWSPFAPAAREEHRLGARFLMETVDLVRSLPSPLSPAVPDGSGPLSALGVRVVAALEQGPMHPDALCEALGERPALVLAELGSLLLTGRIREAPEGAYCKINAQER